MDIFGTNASGISHAVTSSASTAVLLPTVPFADYLKQGKCTIRIVNEGPSIAFFAIGSGASTAATLPTTTAAQTCDAVLPGSDVTFTLKPINDPNSVYFSAICRAAGTANLTIYVGRGA